MSDSETLQGDSLPLLQNVHSKAQQTLGGFRKLYRSSKRNALPLLFLLPGSNSQHNHNKILELKYLRNADKANVLSIEHSSMLDELQLGFAIFCLCNFGVI